MSGVAIARTTIPTCLVLAILLPLLGLARLAADEASAWHFGPSSLGWLMIFSGLVAAGAAALLMRFVAHRLAP